MFYSRFLETVSRWPDVTAIEIQRQSGAAVSPLAASSVITTADGHIVESYSYQQLRFIAECVGKWMLAQGLEPGARCAILASNSPRWVATYLGVVAAGHTAVPLDTAFSAEQVSKLLDDCTASLLVTDARNLEVAQEAIAGRNVHLLMVDGPHDALPCLDEIINAGCDGFVPPPVNGDDVACILYTSGTTSDPKGVMLSHANLRAEMESVSRFMKIDTSDALLGVLPLFHALAQMANLMLPLSFGARIVFLDSLNSTELMLALRERKITIFCCVPQFFYLIHERIFAEAAKKGRPVVALFRMMMSMTNTLRRVGVNPGKLFFGKVHALLGPKMRYFVTGGSRFSAQIGRDFHALGFNILQAYGLTEITGGAFCTPPNDNVIGSIGKPLPGFEAKLVNAKPDEAGHEVGEIALKGPAVMKGYYNRPDATAQVMQGNWFLTGDLAYKDNEGNYFITGRAKDVIVLSSGKNVYPEEIESYYLRSPWIKEICVIGLESQSGEPLSERLHGVIVPNFEVMRQRHIVNAREVIRYDIESISASLPATKRILSYDIWQDDLPRTTTRKIRRFEVESRVKEMHASGEAEAQAAAERALTQQDEEWLLLEDVQRAVEVIRKSAKNEREAIHPDDNLELDLGLDSMERVELLVALEHCLNADVDDSAASEVYTVRELVDLVRANAGSKAVQRMGWDAMLKGEVTDPEVLAIRTKRPIIGTLWYLFGRSVNLASHIVFNLRVSGAEKLPRNGPFIIAPNHTSYLDAPILTAALPWRVFRNVFYVGTSEIFGEGMMRKLARFLRLIPVDPDANLVPAMRAGAYGLEHGRVLVLYPEGERSIDGTVKTFKKGAAILARHLNVPIVPVAQYGFFDSWPRGKGFQGFNPMRIKIGDPIYPDPTEAPEQAYERLTNELRDSVEKMWHELAGKKAAKASAAGK